MAATRGSSSVLSIEDEKAPEFVDSVRQQIVQEVGKRIVGMHDILDELLVSMFAGGHCLLVGVPGLAKTLLISTLADAMSLTFKRIQFTPDLMPTDITGTEVLQEDAATKEKVFRFFKGPLFANIVLADEINRTPPKTQAALLEGMQERKVSVAGDDYPLPEPFFVLATQNPIELEGTYPLPEAQLDRFLFLVKLGYPDKNQELDIIRLVTGTTEESVEPVVAAEQILAIQSLVRQVPAADHILEYATALVRRTRPEEPDAPDYVKRWVSWGAGPRASVGLILAGKSRALLNGRLYVSIEDIQALAKPVIRHRIFLNYVAQSEGASPDGIIEKLIETTPADEKLYGNRAG